MATHSSTLAWKIPWTEELSRLQSMGLQRVGHNWATSLSLFFCNRARPSFSHHQSLPLRSLNKPSNRGQTDERRATVPQWLKQNHIAESSVQFSHSVVSDTLRPHESQHTRPPCPSPSPGVHWDLHPLSPWCHPAISSSVIPFSSCPQSLPASESFPISQLFTWGGQSTGFSASASFLPKNTQDWSPSEWTGWISLQSKGLSRGFSNTTLQKHQFFSTQLSSQSNSRLHTWLLGKP